MEMQESQPVDPNSIRNDPGTEVALTIEHFLKNGDTYKKIQEN